MDPVAATFLDFSARKLHLLLGRIEVALDRLSEGQVWARGSENENAIGNLALHLCGNVRQWIVSGAGGAPDLRERNAEFQARDGIPASELKRRLRTTVDEAAAVIHSLTTERLIERIRPQGYDVSVLEAVYHAVEHFSMHTGQILFAAKMLTGEDLGFYAHLSPKTVKGTAAAHGHKTP